MRVAAGSAAIGFPAFEPGRRTKKGLSWWAIAWIEAMEDSALEPDRLARGRTYANAGRVGSIAVSPGLIAAEVQGSRGRPYRTRVTLQTLSDRQWDAFLDEVASHAGHMAALLDGDMPHELVNAAHAVGVPLLPGQGDLEPECSCPDWGHPCKHAAALCYQSGWLLGAQPFVLLLMRGRGESWVRTELSERNARHAGADSTDGPGTPAPAVSALVAYSTTVAPLPELPGPVTATPTPLVVAPAPGIDPGLLAVLVADAASRAGAMALHPLEPLTEREQTVRLAASLVDTRWFRRVAIGVRDIHRAVAAWNTGGRDGLAALEQPWTPPAAELARARDAIELAWGDDPVPELVVWRNRWTASTRRGRRQLRYGRDRRWYPYVEFEGQWWPQGDPDVDPVAALAPLLST